MIINKFLNIEISAGAIAGIAIGSAALVLLIIMLIIVGIVLATRRKEKGKHLWFLKERLHFSFSPFLAGNYLV